MLKIYVTHELVSVNEWSYLIIVELTKTVIKKKKDENEKINNICYGGILIYYTECFSYIYICCGSTYVIICVNYNATYKGIELLTKNIKFIFSYGLTPFIIMFKY